VAGRPCTIEGEVKVKANVKVEILPDLMAISQRAVEIFVSLASESISAKGRFAVALSGGSTPKKFYSLLGSRPYRDEIDWSSIHFFWVDERCVSREDEESNFKLAFDHLLSEIPVPERNIHRIKGEKGPDLGTRDYEGKIRNVFRNSQLSGFDLVVLGMGEDGHTASLFPGSEALQETRRHAVAVHPAKSGLDRITLTLPILNNASQVLFLVSGLSKANAVKSVLGREEKKELLPAGLVRPLHGSVTWLIDEEAASLLLEELQTA
jgi:6-phosphogluconolactonase